MALQRVRNTTRSEIRLTDGSMSPLGVATVNTALPLEAALLAAGTLQLVDSTFVEGTPDIATQAELDTLAISGTLPGSVTISPVPAPGGIGLTVKDPNGNTMLQVENIGLSSAFYSPVLVFSASNGGIYNGSTFPGGQAWVLGIDVTAAVPYRDLAIAAKVGGWNGSTPGAVFDFVYACHRGLLPPSLQIGTSSAFVPDGLVEMIQSCDGSGNVYDTAMSNLVIRTGAITAGGAVTTPQTAPAIRMRNWASGSDRFLLDADASIRLFDTGGAGLFSIIGTTGRTGIGKDAYNQASDTLRLKENAVDTTFTIATTGGGALKVTAVNASFNVNLMTSNAAALNIGVNSVTHLSITATATSRGIITHTPDPTLSAGATDLSVHTMTPAVAGAFTLTRLNYLQMKQPTGAATITDACVLQFDAAIGTHKAVAAGTTKTTPGAVTAWLKININGTLHYVPAYASQTT